MKKLRRLFGLTLCLAALMSMTLTCIHAAGGKAYASTQAVEVDGKKIEFQMYALRDANGNDTNYVKLRDVAHVLNGTPARFSVGYDNASGTITVTSGQSYTDAGIEMTTPYSGDRAYQTGSGAVLVDGRTANLDAIVLTDDQGGDYTYFKLRDLGDALNFSVDWSAQRGVIVSTGSTADSKPEPSAGTKDIEVTNITTQWGVGYYVKDNGFGTGYLNNGKPITEENVLELLAEAEKIWPTGTSWTNSGTRNNHWYEWSGSVVDSVLLSKYGTSTNYACGGFAAMISDYLFGLDGNPARLVTDQSKIRPGDIIIAMKADGTPMHVTIATSSPIQGGTYAGRVYVAGGNQSAMVSWPDQWSAPTSEQVTQAGSPGRYWVVYTRYPADGTTADSKLEPSAGTKDIEITTKGYGVGTGYYVGDNGFGTGYLNNGKPITEENVLELLAEAEKIWPTGIKWTESGTTGNNWYQNPGTVVNNVLLGKYGTSTYYACGGFAAMISDYLFGLDSNPARLVTDQSKIRPGDIIIAMKANGTPMHVMVATSSPIQGGTYDGRVYYADGNGSATVGWPDEWTMPINETVMKAINGDGCYLLVYTRYPD